MLTPAQYRTEISTQLADILLFWQQYSVDETNGGFIGRLSGDGQVDPTAPKGAVLNARILWTFSAAARHDSNPTYRALANRAYTYFITHFVDNEHGGVYWSLTSAGRPLSTRKQIYALAFAIYGLSEYARLTGNAEPVRTCQALYDWIETKSFDPANGGYVEALNRDGTWLDDMRLSDKDRNDPKTMNTHLHVLEAYVNLYRAWPDAGLAEKIRAMLGTFREHILNPATHQMRLFFTADWQPTANLVSYGHDIEAAWLLLEAAEVLGNKELVAQFRQIAVDMARATGVGLQPDGSLIHELNNDTSYRDTHREWWVSAEAMVGFLNAWQLTGDASFYNQSVRSWQFIQQHILDPQGGEWRWGVYDDYSPMRLEDKIGFWKCPYHNARACLEVTTRLTQAQAKARHPPFYSCLS